MTLKIFFLTAAVLFFSVSLEPVSARDIFQNKTGIKPADSLKVKPAALKDSTAVRKRVLPVPIISPSLVDRTISGSSISRKTIETSDYRTTSDFFSTAPFGFVRDLGTVGQPVETMLYGSGFGNISFLSDGILLNNRISNSFDLNLFQSESIDSIEIVPLARGFLFGASNNTAAVNLIPRKPTVNKPFSRIHYYQAPDGEGFMDGLFNLNPFSRFNAIVEITNQAIDSSITNSGLSNWIGSARLRYMISNDMNITAGYKYSNTITRLSGGVNRDSILTSQREEFQTYGSNKFTFDQIFYDRLGAPVKFTDRYQKVSDNNFDIRMLAKFAGNSFTDLSFYYKSSLAEYRQNEYSVNSPGTLNSISDNNSYKTAGLNLRQDLQRDLYRLTAIANWEYNKFDSPLIPSMQSLNTFSASGQLSFRNVFEHISPAVFAKILRYSEKNIISYGADANFRLNDKVSLYAGVSRSGQPFSPVQMSLLSSDQKQETRTNNSAEVKFLFESKSFTIQAGYFLISTHNSPAAYNTFASSDSGIVSYARLFNSSLNGFNLSLSLHYWKLLLISNSSLYMDKDNSAPVNDFYKMPSYTSFGGIYYVDTLFEKNLHLKTGLNYSAVGSRNYYSQDFERMLAANIFTSAVNQSAAAEKYNPSFQLDFFFAGRIRNSATIYFIFQNILNAQYFIVPYYPKQPRALRFGISWDFLD